MRKLTLGVAVSLLTVALCTEAAKYIVKGIVADASDNGPCSGTLIRIYGDSDTIMPMASNLADSLGHFEQILDSAGHYTLKAEFLGTVPQQREFLLDETNTTADLDTIFMPHSEETLEEFVVSVKKPLIESDGGTLTYNMTEDPMAEGNSVLEMLRKVPMVTVDAQETIKVKGSTNFKIYLNGKEDPMLSGDPKTILKSMPASNIKKIEVITEPGAKYDAEGTGGILNIVTVTKQNLEGVVGNIGTWVNRSSAGGSAYVRTKIKNVTASVNASYNHSLNKEWNNYTSQQRSDNLANETDHSRRTSGTTNYDYSYTGGGFDLSWEPDTLNLFTASGSIGYNTNNNYTSQEMSMFTINDDLRWKFNRDFTYRNKGLWTSVEASYQHTFKKEGHHIVGSYKYSFNNHDGGSIMESHGFINYSEEFPWRRNQNDSHSNGHTLQIDYANPITEKHLIEAGLKGNMLRNNSLSAPWYGTTESNMEKRESETVSMAQFQNIAAMYASYTGNYGKWGLRVGLRYEYTDMGIDYFTKGYENFSSRFSDLVPNASVTYRLRGVQNFRLAYQMRISRPGVYVLNPYRNTMTVGEVYYGNPDLQSEKSHNINLTYSNYGGKVGGSVRTGYNHVGNQITSYMFIKDGIINNTYENIGTNEEWFIGGDLQWTIIPDMQLSLSSYLQWENYKADTPVLKRKRHGWYWNYNANWDYRLPCKVSISAYGGQGSRWFNLDSEGQGWYYYGISASRGFLKDETLRITLYGQSFIPPHRNYHYLATSENIRNETWSRQQQWYAGISISWRFGKLNSDVKRTGARIESESVAGDSGAKGNSGGGR